MTRSEPHRTRGVSARRALRAVREIRSERGRPSAMDLAYTVYVGVLTVLILGIPVLRAIVLELVEPDAAAVLATAGGRSAAVAFGLAAAALMVAGGARGPALLTPFLTATLTGSGLSRATTLRRPFLRSVLGSAGLGALALLLPGLALLVAGRAEPMPVTMFAGAGALAGVVCAGSWLLGQRLGAGARSGAAALLIGFTALALAVPSAESLTPWSWLAALFPIGSGIAEPPLAALAALALVLLACAPVLLRGLPGPDLLAQSRRWEATTTLVTTGDLAMAAGGYRPVPRRGRGLRAIRGRSEWTLFARRDLVGSLRTPARAAAACLGTAVSGYLVAVALCGTGVALWIPALAAALVGFLSLGVWADGYRHVVELASGPPLYGIPTTRLLLLHSTLPVMGGVLGALVGAGIAIAGGAGWLALLVAPSAALLLVAVRLLDAAKGPLPVEVMSPVVTPVGDASSLVIAAWQADALILACGSVIGLVSAVAAVGPLGALIALPLGAVIAYRGRRRIQNQRA